MNKTEKLKELMRIVCGGCECQEYTVCQQCKIHQLVNELLEEK